MQLDPTNINIYVTILPLVAYNIAELGFNMMASVRLSIASSSLPEKKNNVYWLRVVRLCALIGICMKNVDYIYLQKLHP